MWVCRHDTHVRVVVCVILCVRAFAQLCGRACLRARVGARVWGPNPVVLFRDAGGVVRHPAPAAARPCAARTARFEPGDGTFARLMGRSPL